MPRFFIDFIPSETAVLTGENAKHISKSLRMQKGEEITLCDGNGKDYFGVISDITDTDVSVSIKNSELSCSEPNVNIHLYQAMPKGDKFEYIIQKSVELGVSEITPIITSRCISRPDQKSMEKKLERFNKISLEASKQSGRGRIVPINSLLSFDSCIKQAQRSDLALFLYEVGGSGIKSVLDRCKTYKTISIIVGSEGGFSEEEALLAQNSGLILTYLGRRILRCETAPTCAISSIMFHSGNLE